MARVDAVSKVLLVSHSGNTLAYTLMSLHVFIITSGCDVIVEDFFDRADIILSSCVQIVHIVCARYILYDGFLVKAVRGGG